MPADDDDSLKSLSESEFSLRFSSKFNTFIAVVVLVMLNLSVNDYVEVDGILERISRALHFISAVLAIFLAGDAMTMIKVRPETSGDYRCVVYRSFPLYALIVLASMLLILMASRCPDKTMATKISGIIRSVNTDTRELGVELPDGTMTTLVLLKDIQDQKLIRSIIDQELQALVHDTLICELAVRENIIQSYSVYCEGHKSGRIEFAIIFLAVAASHYFVASPKSSLDAK